MTRECKRFNVCGNSEKPWEMYLIYKEYFVCEECYEEYKNMMKTFLNPPTPPKG